MADARTTNEFEAYLRGIGIADEELRAGIRHIVITKAQCEAWLEHWFAGLVPPLERTFASILGFELEFRIHLTPAVIMADLSELQAALSGWLVLSAPFVRPDVVEDHIVKSLRFDSRKRIRTTSSLSFEMDLEGFSAGELGLFGLLREATHHTNHNALTVIDLDIDETILVSRATTVIPAFMADAAEIDRRVWLSFTQQGSRFFERIS